jgi:hypothetical protein
MSGKTTNGGLKDLTDRSGIKAKLAAAECHNQGKRRRTDERRGNLQTQKLKNFFLNAQSRREGQTIQRH